MLHQLVFLHWHHISTLKRVVNCIIAWRRRLAVLNEAGLDILAFAGPSTPTQYINGNWQGFVCICKVCLYVFAWLFVCIIEVRMTTKSSVTCDDSSQDPYLSRVANRRGKKGRRSWMKEVAQIPTICVDRPPFLFVRKYYLSLINLYQ